MEKIFYAAMHSADHCFQTLSMSTCGNKNGKNILCGYAAQDKNFSTYTNPNLPSIIIVHFWMAML